MKPVVEASQFAFNYLPGTPTSGFENTLIYDVLLSSTVRLYQNSTKLDRGI